MKSLSVAIPLLIVSSFGWISAQKILHPKSNVDSWFNMELDDLADNCHLKENGSIIGRLVDEYEDTKMKFLSPIEKQEIEESNFVMHYIYNSDMINKLKELIKGIQYCLDDKDRLDSEGVAEVMDQILNQYAMKIANVEPLSEKDILCFSTDNKAHVCNNLLLKTDFLHEQKVTHLLKLGDFRNSTCEENLPYFQCIMKELKHCSPKVKKVFGLLLSPPEVTVCNNYLQEADPEIEEIGEEISDLFKREEEKSFSFKKFLRL